MLCAEGLEMLEDGAQQQEVGHWGGGQVYWDILFYLHLLSLLSVYHEVINLCRMSLISPWAQSKGDQEV